MVLGIQTEPAESEVVPPTTSAFSKIVTDRPRREPVRAAVIPAAPDPTTIKSVVSVSTLVLLYQLSLTGHNEFGFCKFIIPGKNEFRFIKCNRELPKFSG